LNSTAWEEFRAAADRFCTLVDSAEERSTEDFLAELQERLAEIYWSASRLRPSFNDSDAPKNLAYEVQREAYERLRKKLGEEPYRFVFSPWEDNDVVESTLAHDLAETYYDLKSCLHDPRGDKAMWDSRWAFDHHWGRHALQALHAVHWLRHP
jgi:hypothetical protein